MVHWQKQPPVKVMLRLQFLVWFDDKEHVSSSHWRLLVFKFLQEMDPTRGVKWLEFQFKGK